ncbi:MAG: hypothetical protein SNJ29_13455 [Rikenellaceae bacterium]
MENIKLTDSEKRFCELFVDGDKDFAGRAEACYREVFGEEQYGIIAARQLLAKDHIKAHIKLLIGAKDTESEVIAIRLQVAETLRSIMSEAAKGEYLDRFGVPLSPAPLRAVSVNAAKALMDIFPISNSQSETIKNEGNGNIIFNVVVPQTAVNNGDKKE